MTLILEAALRSLLLAILVGGVILMFRIRNPHIEKTLWAAVLGCALLMPAFMSWPPHSRLLSCYRLWRLPPARRV